MSRYYTHKKQPELHKFILGSVLVDFFKVKKKKSYIGPKSKNCRFSFSVMRLCCSVGERAHMLYLHTHVNAELENL